MAGRKRARASAEAPVKRILVVDVGGNNVKVHLPGRSDVIRIPSGPHMTAARMAAEVKKAVAGADFDAVTVGFPGPVAHGRPLHEPVNLGAGWVRFDYAKAFGRPVKLINDAAMQALGSYRGGQMLFLGLGTGLGSAMVIDGEIAPMELAHMPYRKSRSFEDYVGERARRRCGVAKWSAHVARVVEILRAGLQAHEVVLGGGNVKKLARLPPDVRAGDNEGAPRLGGRMLWAASSTRAAARPAARRRTRR